MSKCYVKDSNGKYKLVQKNENQEPIVMVNQQLIVPTIEELDARLRKVESFLFLAGVKK